MPRVVDWTAEPVELETAAPAPPPEQRRRETVEALIGLVEDSRPSDPESQLARALLEQRTMAWQFRRLGREVGRDLGWRAESVADEIERALDRFFPDVELAGSGRA